MRFFCKTFPFNTRFGFQSTCRDFSSSPIQLRPLIGSLCIGFRRWSVITLTVATYSTLKKKRTVHFLQGKSIRKTNPNLLESAKATTPLNLFELCGCHDLFSDMFTPPKKIAGCSHFRIANAQEKINATARQSRWKLLRVDLSLFGVARVTQ